MCSLPVEGDLADLHLGSFIHFEDDFERGWRHLVQLRLDGGELAAALGQVFLQDHAGRAGLDWDRTAIRR